MAASIIRRGVDHVRIPTTLIGQIDAGVGVKGGINFDGKKNFLGCFYPPQAVLVQPPFLQSLPERLIIAGLAEIIKMAVIRDHVLFEMVREYHRLVPGNTFRKEHRYGIEIIQRSITGMLEELTPNLFENQSYKRLVDFGHTFSPALEAASGYRIHHGEAVSIDMALSTTLAYRLGMISEYYSESILTVLTDVGLPIFSYLLNSELCIRALQDCSRHRGGCVNLVVPSGIGSATFIDKTDLIPQDCVEAAIEALASRSGSDTTLARQALEESGG
jgi:3-dehydroquinate synthase